MPSISIHLSSMFHNFQGELTQKTQTLMTKNMKVLVRAKASHVVLFDILLQLQTD